MYERALQISDDRSWFQTAMWGYSLQVAGKIIKNQATKKEKEKRKGRWHIKKNNERCSWTL